MSYGDPPKVSFSGKFQHLIFKLKYKEDATDVEVILTI